MRRHLLAVASLLLIFAGFIGWLRYSDSAAGAGFAGSAVRIGIVLAALWLAWPDVTRWNPWLTAATLLSVALVVINIKAIFIVGPILFAIWFFSIRTGRQGPPAKRA